MDLINFSWFLLSLTVGFLLIKYAERFINKLVNSKSFKEAVKLTKYSDILLWYSSYFIKLSLYVIVLLFSVSFLGLTSQVLTLIVFVIILSITGILVYSVKDLIPSAFAGAYLIHSSVIKKGDKISINGFKGVVKDVSLLNITIKDKDGKIVLIPNKVISESVLRKF